MIKQKKFLYFIIIHKKMSYTFKLEENDDLVFDSTGFYCRAHGEFISSTADAIAQKYEQTKAFMVQSGMSAIYITLKSICMEHREGILLFSNELYTDTYGKIMTLLMSEFPSISFLEFDIYDQADLEKKIISYKSKLFAIFLESASNPTSQMLDWKTLNIPNNIYFIVDNTWLSPANFNPFDHRADIVTDSCTKYISAGKCIAGAIVFKNNKIAKKIIKRINDNLKATGSHVSPVNCDLVKKGLECLNNTITKISDRVPSILGKFKELQDIGLVQEVVHHSLGDHPAHKKFMKYTKGYNVGIVYFHVQSTNKLGINFRYNIEQIVTPTSIKLHTSYGKSYDLFCRYCYKDETGLGVWLRLSVGYSDNPNLLDDLGKICTEISKL
jgi:cystathionine beta-lyase/cystathionine gamma-synthase